MHLIYSRAPRVLAWMGPSSGDIELAESWIRTYVPGSPFTFKSWYWLSLKLKSHFSPKAKLRKYMALMRALDGYLEFFANPYWTRMWTYQEYRLASHRRLCLFGDRAARHIRSDPNIGELLSSRAMIAATKGEQLLVSPRFLKFYLREPVSAGALMAEIQAMMGRSNSINLMRVPAASILMFDYPGISGHLAGCPLLELLTQTFQYQFSNPHDRVYALYGLCPGLAEAYPVDYTKPYGQVVSETAAYILNNELTGGAMYLFFGLRDGHLTDNLHPSWVPDFGPKSEVPDLEGAQYITPFNHPYEIPRTKITNDLKILHLWGRSLGRCKVTYRFSPEDEARAAQIGQIWLDPSRLLGCDINSNILKSSEDLEVRLTYACILRRLNKTLHGRDQLFSRFTRLLLEWAHYQLTIMERERNTNSESGEEYSELDEAVGRLKGKALIVTESGFFGTASQHVQNGDIVVLPPQVGTPIILTTRDEAAGKQPTIYKLVGTTYIDGLCRGACEDAAAASGIFEQRDLEEFMIR